MKPDFVINDKDFVYTGISIVDAKKIINLDTVNENFFTFDDKRIALNVNTKDDYDLLGSF